MPQDYYVILGIPADSTQTDIKAAYRRLAKEFHPDYYGQNHEPFQVVQEAYSVLSDPESRRIYDESLQDTPRKYQARNVQPVHRSYHETIEPLVPGRDAHFSNRHFPDRSFYHPHTPINSIFDQFFGTSRSRQQLETSRAEDITVEVSLTPAQAQSGGRLRLQVPIRMPCPACHGKGYSRYATCHHCHGAGVLSGQKTVVLPYPAGIRKDHSLQFVLRPSPAGEISLNVLFRIK
ncbi:DnaJ domain-containing protein [Desulfocastanea catecholica]